MLKYVKLIFFLVKSSFGVLLQQNCIIFKHINIFKVFKDGEI